MVENKFRKTLQFLPKLLLFPLKHKLSSPELISTDKRFHCEPVAKNDISNKLYTALPWVDVLEGMRKGILRIPRFNFVPNLVPNHIPFQMKTLKSGKPQNWFFFPSTPKTKARRLELELYRPPERERRHPFSCRSALREPSKQ